MHREHYGIRIEPQYVAPTSVHIARSACERAYKQAIENTRGDIIEFTAKLCGINSWEGHYKAKLRATLPLRCTGLGIDLLCTRVMAMVLRRPQ